MRFTRRLAAIVTATALALGLAIVPAATAGANTFSGYSGLEITTASVGPFTVGQSVSLQLTATRAGFWYGSSWNTHTGEPSGLVVNSSGLVSGTLAQPGKFLLQPQVEDSNWWDCYYYYSNYCGWDYENFYFDVKPVVTTVAVATATTGVPFAHTFGGTAAGFRYFELTGPLPAGLSFNQATGTISGTPTLPPSDNAASFPLSVKVYGGSTQGSEVASDPISVTLTVEQVAPSMTTAPLPAATVGVAYSAQLTASGNGTLSYAATGLPAGLTLNAATGAISGTPTYDGYTTAVTTVPVSATAANARVSAAQALSIAVTTPAPSISSVALPDAPVEAAYSQLLPVTGYGALSVSLKAGSELPSGLTLAADGTVSGTPDYDVTYGADEVFPFTAVITGPGGSAEASYALRVTVAQPTVVTGTLVEGWLTQSYLQPVAVAGPGAVLSVTGLPAGLSLDGDIVGTPTVAGEFPIVITSTNGAGTVSRSITLVINPAAVVTTGSVARGVVGTAYSQQFAASGKNVTFALAGVVPAGAAITPAGLLTWTPTAEGPTAFRVSAANLSGTDTRTFSVTSYVLPTISTGALAAGQQGRLYLGAVAFTGLDTTVALAGGTLPRGVTIDSAGRLSGVPTQNGTFRFDVTAANFAGSVTQTVTLRVAAPIVPVTASGATPAGIADSLPPAQLPTDGAAEAADANLPTLAEPETTAAPDAAGDPANVLGFVLGGILLLMLALLVAFLVRRRQVAAD